MEEIRVIVVEPKYQINLGYIARTLMNFGIRKINLVKPRCNYKGKQAIKYSKHAHELLEKAKIYPSFQSSIADAGLVVGTTGIWHKSGKSFFNVYTFDKLLDLIKNNKIKSKKISLIIGRDDTGLTKEELAMCDATVFIPADKDYPILNISHALAILLYGLTKERGTSQHYDMQRMYADTNDTKRIFRLFEILVKSKQDIRDKPAVIAAFNHIIRRSAPTKKELSALAIALAHGIKNKKNKK